MCGRGNVLCGRDAQARDTDAHPQARGVGDGMAMRRSRLLHGLLATREFPERRCRDHGIMAPLPVSYVQVPAMTRPVGVQRIRPAMVCVQVELSRWMERVQVKSTGFHVPLMAYGEDRGSPETGDEAPDSSVLTFLCV